MDRGYWISLYLLQWNANCVGSSPLSSSIHTSSKVGLSVVLPCAVTSHLDHPPHIQWQTVQDSVFERMGEEQFQGEAYKHRADVPEAILVQGNCSLFLQDVRFSDAGIYKSYLVVDESSFQNRIFIQSVHLSVVDHKSTKYVETGKDLTLDLYTNQAQLVIFQNSNDTAWTVVWERDGDKNNKCHLSNNKLTFKSVTASSAGMYKVLDSEGLALSTVKVLITEPVREPQILERKAVLGKATMSTPFLKIIITFLTFHLVLPFN
ncbi:galectin 17 isoform X1 [Misgurnus anguillicaudatus]|uniref:galectin 17 isoform X1 n=1 Tax=Misgurnus anguillicaudatus TaxID=75329 RepID=UPI003CCFC99A